MWGKIRTIFKTSISFIVNFNAAKVKDLKPCKVGCCWDSFNSVWTFCEFTLPLFLQSGMESLWRRGGARAGPSSAFLSEDDQNRVSLLKIIDKFTFWIFYWIIISHPVFASFVFFSLPAWSPTMWVSVEWRPWLEPYSRVLLFRSSGKMSLKCLLISD